MDTKPHENVSQVKTYRYRCKYCSIIFKHTDLDKFLLHKRQNHYEEIKRNQAKNKIIVNQQQPHLNKNYKYNTASKGAELLGKSAPEINVSTTEVDVEVKSLAIIGKQDKIQDSDKNKPPIKANSELKASSIQTGRRMQLCPKCPYTAMRKYRLELHLKVHLSKTSLKCPICSIQFADSVAVKIHAGRFHSKKNPEHVKKLTAFLQRNPPTRGSKNHNKLNQKYKPAQYTEFKKRSKKKRIPGGYRCHYCHRTYDIESLRNTHETYHTLPVVCPLCNKGTPNNAHLLSHYKKVHPGHKLDTSSLTHIYKPREHWKKLEKKQN